MWIFDYPTSKQSFVINGFKFGFYIPFQGCLPKHPPRNLLSASQLPHIVDTKLGKELQLGRIAGPFHISPFKNLVLSPIGLVPKKVAGEYRLIHHLSHPHGGSVNSGIDRQFTNISYHTVDQAIQILCQLPIGSYMAKTDIKSAFRIIPIHPSCYHLLGFTWKQRYYYDKTLAMGLSSSCQVFEHFSTALQWIAMNHLHISHMLHILDDFLIISPTERAVGAQLQDFITLCNELGVPLAPEKTEGPTTIITFAGIELD